MEKINYWFEKVKKAHDIYVRVSNEKKLEILNSFDWVFKKLESLGVSRRFSESLLIWGKEFTDSLSDNNPVVSDNNPIVSDRFNQTEVAEQIFQTKAKDMTDQEQRELALANKHGVLAWVSQSGSPSAKINSQVEISTGIKIKSLISRKKES